LYDNKTHLMIKKQPYYQNTKVWSKHTLYDQNTHRMIKTHIVWSKHTRMIKTHIVWSKHTSYDQNTHRMIKTHIVWSIKFFFPKRVVYEINVEKCGTATEATDDNITRRCCEYFFSTATMVAWGRLNVKV
jgi:hypothetical protein